MCIVVKVLQCIIADMYNSKESKTFTGMLIVLVTISQDLFSCSYTVYLLSLSGQLGLHQ